MPKKTIVNQAYIERSTVDVGTGEVKQLDIQRSEGTRTIHSSEPPFVKLYISDILYTYDMPKGLTNVVYALLEQVTYAKKGQLVSISVGLKNQICEQLGMPRQTLNNAITKLVKGHILERVDTGLYRLNPYFFGLGEWKDIDNLRTTWKYDDIKGRTFGGLVLERKNGVVERTNPEEGTIEITEPDVDYPDGGEDDRLNAEERADRYDPAV